MKKLILTVILAVASFSTQASEVAQLYLNGDSSAVIGNSETTYGVNNLFFITKKRIELIQIGLNVTCNEKIDRINSKRIAIKCIQEDNMKIIRRIKSQAGRNYIIHELKTKGTLDWEGWKATDQNFIDNFEAIGNDKVL
ncbi:hypothetical protein [Photobacterium iliopiscarium]|uniref:hypothetical protein n=1 Tax=Photobacterium iliopiscarium TaxID=56192 RepID=UPI001E39E2EC|nr:hypothetical protein [Photobacterium iliopiscarium]MCD9468940.1 hypothetical protein [Photobacterium iliopiscarium]